QRSNVQLPVLKEYVLRAVRVVLQLRIAPAPAVRIIINVVAFLIAPLVQIERAAFEFILPNKIHPRDRWIARCTNLDIVMIRNIWTRRIWVSNKRVGNVIVADASACLTIQRVPDADLHINLYRLEPQSINVISPVSPLIGI